MASKGEGIDGTGLGAASLAQPRPARASRGEEPMAQPSNIESVPANTLRYDATLYPREHVNQAHVGELVDAIAAGASLPALIVDRASRVIVDGVHRWFAATQMKGPHVRITVQWQDYPDRAAIFEDAIRRNAGHGRRFTPKDRQHAVQMAAALSIAPERLAAAMVLTVDRLNRYRPAPPARAATTTHIVRPVAAPAPPAPARPEPAPIAGIAWLMKWLESDRVDWDDEHLVKGLRALARLLNVKLAARRSA